MYLDLTASSGYTKGTEKLEKSDSKINLQSELKATTNKKLRFRAWAHSLSEFLYILIKNGLTLRHRTYAIDQSKEDLLE